MGAVTAVMAGTVATVDGVNNRTTVLEGAVLEGAVLTPGVVLVVDVPV